MSYAQNTKVPIARSQAEIQSTLKKYGATGFAFAEKGAAAMIMFELQGRRIMFRLPMPTPPSANANGASIKTYEQLCRSRWRALVLGIKAKLECVESKITTLEDEFLAHIVLPSGETVGDVIADQITASYQSGTMPPLLGYGK